MADVLTAADRERIIQLYESRLAEGLPDHRVGGWGSRESQVLRFRTLAEVAELDGRRVLDVGCGLADFFFHLRDAGVRGVRYVGIDLSPRLVEAARARLRGHADADVVCGDVLTHAFTDEADVVVLSGALNLRVADNWEYARRVLTRLFTVAREAVAANFLSSYVDFVNPKDFHYEPERMFSLARTLTRRVVLRHDYPLYEFTLYLYRAGEAAPPARGARAEEPR